MKTNNSAVVFLVIVIASLLTGCEKDISITTYDVSSITDSSATFSGRISGGDEITIYGRGFCWGKSINPTIVENCLYNGSSLGRFSINVTGLEDYTIYYVRAFMVSSNDTIYGNEHSFITKVGIPNACFDYSDTSGLKISFTNCSEHGTTFFWDFGDGVTSTQKEPIHEYNSVGSYNVKLTVTNERLSDIVMKSITVSGVVSLNRMIVPDGNIETQTSLDVDGDSVNDFQFIVGNITSGGGRSTYSYSRIVQLNKYEINVDSALSTSEEYMNNGSHRYYTNLVAIPKIYIFEDTILNSGLMGHNIINMAFYSNSIDFYSQTSSWITIWIKSEERYIGFRNKNDTKTLIGWIKLTVLDYAKIWLDSYKIPTEAEILIIDR